MLKNWHWTQKQRGKKERVKGAMSKFFKQIARLIRALWSIITVSRRIIGNLIFIAVILFLAGVFFYSGSDEVPEGAALLLSPVGNIVEQASEPLMLDRFFRRIETEEILLQDIIDGIDHAAEDKNIKVLVLDMRRMGAAGISKLQDIGAALNRFKKSGKKIFATGDFFNQQQYYLAAHADRIYLHPMGQVWLIGFEAYRKYFKTAIEKLLIQFHVFRVGTYKSTLEPFFRDDMSEAAKQANTAWLNVLWDAYKSDVASLRGIDASSIDALINNIGAYLAKEGGDSAKLALHNGLVDALKTRDEVRDELIEIVGKDKSGKTYKQIAFNRYLEIVRPDILDVDSSHGKVGVIVAKGIIMDGNQPAGRIGGDSLAELIRRARQNKDVKAVVLRINSGGGSALASEIIRREVELTRQAGKPVVVSMGSVAASGGYWMSVSADEIWASPTTITGSIGIFAALPTFDKSLDALGIHTDGVGTTKMAGAFDLSRPLNPLLADLLQNTIERGYQRFIERVSEGRKMDPQIVEQVAQGRVWAGKTALELGLVDKLGNLKDAVRSAAKLANLIEYGVIYIKKPPTARELLMKKLFRLLAGMLPDMHGQQSRPVIELARSVVDDEALQAVMLFNDPQHVYALCLNCRLN